MSTDVIFDAHCHVSGESQTTRTKKKPQKYKKTKSILSQGLTVLNTMKVPDADLAEVPPAPLALPEGSYDVRVLALDGSGRPEEAVAPFLEAQRLDPDNWNYHRQPWSFDPSSSGEKFRAKYETLKGAPYYAEPELARKAK